MSQRSFAAETAWLWIQGALDSAKDGILIETAERVAYTNQAYAEMLGYRRSADLVYRSIAEIVSLDDADRLTRFGRMRTAGQRAPSEYDFAALRRDGSAIHLQASVSLSIFGRTPYITTIVRPLPEPDHNGESAALPGPHENLSARERQVMEMLLAGRRAKVIALDLDLTENTVATHRTRLLQKLGVTDTRELFRYALRHRLVDWS